MALSTKTIHNLADALTPEVIDYIYADERWIELMMEIIPEAVIANLKSEDYELVSEISYCIYETLEIVKKI